MPLFTPTVFDLTLTTIFAPLCSGGQIRVLPEKDPEALLGEIFSPSSPFRAVKLTPAHLTLLAAQGIEPGSPVALAIVGGRR